MPNKILVEQILLVVAIMFVGLWASAQWAAALLAYQSELGQPSFHFPDCPLSAFVSLCLVVSLRRLRA